MIQLKGFAVAVTNACHQAEFEVADFNGDGDFDTLMVQPSVEYSKRTLVVYENADGAGNEWIQHDFFITDDVLAAKTLTIEDFKNDGWMDGWISLSVVVFMMGRFYLRMKDWRRLILLKKSWHSRMDTEIWKLVI
ncbi:MAG: hypothetical protein ACJAYJ_000439 [Saprospiraceae bacterium]